MSQVNAIQFSDYQIDRERVPIKGEFLKKDEGLLAPADYEARRNFGLDSLRSPPLRGTQVERNQQKTDFLSALQKNVVCP
jgi:hypothetical protein